ncbi:MAG: beta-ketoacyl-[acyl-carrier-protein] synthase family protein [Candidatus Omnitrophota bacterium]|nr:beta-ketoacyl-[acyl-carrier-protein] synthase family protein [Candidatus Omnitrophota bacterium]MDZ4241341.1 beta-ketoacyl-[acyl-carrier-protein] synthase family protein [Candidatus Omnitrophota bacterium]
MAERVVITGLGILTCNGKGREDYWQALREGRDGIRPVSLFDTAEFNVKQAGEVSDFDATIYMGIKGLRTLDRSTKLLVSAARLAIADSGFTITEENTDDVGVSCGTTLGSLKSISDFDEVTLREGPRNTNPALFPNTVINSPASQVSIWNNIKGFNTTISTGFTASMDAIQYGCEFIMWDRAKLVYAGGVEELCMQTFFGFYALKFMSGSKDGQPFINCPFDKRRNGIAFAEGACLIAFEEEQHALARGAKILGEVLSFGYSFDTARRYKYNPRGTGLKIAMTEALNNAELKPSDIDCIFSDANSTPGGDKVEALAIKEVFGDHAKKVPVTAVKSMIGESFSVCGAFNVSAALMALNHDFIPPTINYREPDPDCDLNYVVNTGRKARLKNILVMNFSPTGSNNCMVLGRYEK